MNIRIYYNRNLDSHITCLLRMIVFAFDYEDLRLKSISLQPKIA